MDKYTRAKVYVTGQSAALGTIPKHHGVIISGPSSISVTCKMMGAGLAESDDIVLITLTNNTQFFPVQLSSISAIAGVGGKVILLY